MQARMLPNHDKVHPPHNEDMTTNACVPLHTRRRSPTGQREHQHKCKLAYCTPGQREHEHKCKLSYLLILHAVSEESVRCECVRDSAQRITQEHLRAHGPGEPPDVRWVPRKTVPDHAQCARGCESSDRVIETDILKRDHAYGAEEEETEKEKEKKEEEEKERGWGGLRAKK